MDANNTRFHLLMGRHDWEPLLTGEAPNPSWDGERNSLSLRPLLFRFKASPNNEVPDLENRRGAARDMYGNWYWISGDGAEIIMLPMGMTQPQHYWSVADLVNQAPPALAEGDFGPAAVETAPTSLEFRGLAVTEHHYLVVGVREPAGLLVFDLHGGGPPDWLLWPENVDFDPFDMAPAPGGGLYVLDATHRRYWALDRRLDVVCAAEPPDYAKTPDDFQPVAGDPAKPKGRWQPEGIVAELAAHTAASAPIAIEALPDGSVLILGEGEPSRIYRTRNGKSLGNAVLTIPRHTLETDGTELGNPTPVPIRAYDLAFLPAAAPASPQVLPLSAGPPDVAGTLYVTVSDGNQTFAFTLEAVETDMAVELQMRYFPMRLFGGKGLVATGGEVYYDYKESWVPLTEQRRPRYELTGTLEIARPFDGRQVECVWHRVFLDACIPPGASVKLETRAADDPDLLADLPWQEEPQPYLRTGGAELPYYQPFGAEELRQEGTGTWELLLQRARGQYLQLRLTLSGTGRNTPRIRAMRLYYPRFSYLNEYLPALYRDDRESAHFLDRFLSNPEGLFTALEDRIAQAQFLFDVRTAPAEYLDWLAGWFGVMLDGAWDETRRRFFIAHAPELFAQRGTVAGVLRAVRLATDPCLDESLFTEDPTEALHSIRIVESFLTRRAPGVVFGDPSDSGGPGMTADSVQWTPDQGTAMLHEHYAEFMAARLPGATPSAKMPATLPADKQQAEVWREFLRTGLGFHYEAVTSADLPLWEQFIKARYRRTDPLPASVPESGKPLYDWIQFVSIHLPTVRSAHRFTVLVPSLSYGTDSPGPDPELVRRIVELEKPAHTQFEVKEYWAMFRVGEARLGLDTVVDRGARLPALVLGQGYLAQGFLAYRHPWNVTDRRIVGSQV